MGQANMKTNTAVEYDFMDFINFHEFTLDPVMSGNLISLYQSIFAEHDGWNEHYSYNDVYQNLAHELDGNAHLRVCHDAVNEEEVVAFCWAQLQTLSNVCQAIKTVQHYEMIGSPDICTPLKNILGDEPVIYLHDLGVKRELRGKLSLSQLIYPTLQGLARQTGIHKVLFWTIANTNVSKLARRGGFEIVKLHSGMQFYAGTVEA